VPQKSGIVIERVTITGFRGYREPKTISLGGKSALLTGPIWSGKSSTLGAIEWCLFDDFYSVRTDRTTYRDELVNDHSPSISVKLELRFSGKPIIVERTKQRGTSKSKLIIDFGEEKTISGPEAQNRLFKILGLGFDDFVRAVYLHQEDIRAIITEDRKARSEAMDRLFGLDKLRNISDSMKPSLVKSYLNSLEGKRESIVSGISGRVNEAARNLDIAKQAAYNMGLSEKNLTLQNAQNLLLEAKRKVDRCAESVGLEEKAGLPSISSVSNISECTAVIGSTIRKIRKHTPEDKDLKTIIGNINELNSALSELADAKAKFSLAEKEVRVFCKRNGSKSVLESRLSALGKRINKLEEQKNELDVKGKLVQTGLKYLEEVASLSKCPICNKPVKKDEVLEHLEKEAKVAISAKLRSLDSRIDRAEGKRRETEDAIEEYNDLNERVEAAKKRLDDRVAEVSRVLKRAVTVEAVEREINKELSSLESRKKKIEAPIRKREEALDTITELVTKADRIGDVLRQESRCEILSNLQNLPELKRIEGAIRELASLHRQVELVNNVALELQTELASGMIAKHLGSIQRFYSRITNHPYYDRLKIEVEEDTRGGVLKNLYLIKGVSEKDGGESLVSQKFSTGHMNCVGLSVFLALVQDDAYTHNLNFLIMDDPSQNLDGSHKQSLAKLLASMREGIQVIVSTQDEEFQQYLTRAFEDKDMTRIEFESWDKDGPKFKVTR